MRGNVPRSVWAQRLRYTQPLARAWWNRRNRHWCGAGSLLRLAALHARAARSVNILSADRGWLVRNDLGLLGTSAFVRHYFRASTTAKVGGPRVNTPIGDHRLVMVAAGGYRQPSDDVSAGSPISKPKGFDTPRE